MLPEDVASDDEDDEDVNLAALDSEENDDRGRGRPSNASLHDFEWSTCSKRSDVEIPSFSQAVGPTNVMPRESSAVHFFKLFVDNHILGNKLLCLPVLTKARNKDIGSWKDISLEEQKPFVGLICISIHRLPSLRDYWSSDWVLAVPAFGKVMPRKRFLDIWNNLYS